MKPAPTCIIDIPERIAVSVQRVLNTWLSSGYVPAPIICTAGEDGTVHVHLSPKAGSVKWHFGLSRDIAVWRRGLGGLFSNTGERGVVVVDGEDWYWGMNTEEA